MQKALSRPLLSLHGFTLETEEEEELLDERTEDDDEDIAEDDDVTSAKAGIEAANKLRLTIVAAALFIIKKWKQTKTIAV